MAILPVPGDAVPARLLITVRKGAHGSAGEVEDLHARESGGVYRVLNCGQVSERVGPGREEIRRDRGIEDARALLAAAAGLGEVIAIVGLFLIVGSQNPGAQAVDDREAVVVNLEGDCAAAICFGLSKSRDFPPLPPISWLSPDRAMRCQ